MSDVAGVVCGTDLLRTVSAADDHLADRGRKLPELVTAGAGSGATAAAVGSDSAAATTPAGMDALGAVESSSERKSVKVPAKASTPAQADAFAEAASNAGEKAPAAATADEAAAGAAATAATAAAAAAMQAAEEAAEAILAEAELAWDAIARRILILSRWLPVGADTGLVQPIIAQLTSPPKSSLPLLPPPPAQQRELMARTGQREDGEVASGTVLHKHEAERTLMAAAPPALPARAAWREALWKRLLSAIPMPQL
ncbi:unnamed protein product [Phaeothamnion confervicola]